MSHGLHFQGELPEKCASADMLCVHVYLSVLTYLMCMPRYVCLKPGLELEQLVCLRQQVRPSITCADKMIHTLFDSTRVAVISYS